MPATAQRHIPETVRSALERRAAWAVAAVLFCFTARWTYLSHSVVAFLTCGSAAVLCLPPFRALLARRLFQLPLKHAAIAVAVLATIALGFTMAGKEEVDERRATAAQWAARAKKEAVQNERLDYYAANKPEVVADIKAKLESGQANAAMQLINQYSFTRDPALVALSEAAQLALMREELARGEGSMTLERRAIVYTALSAAEPSNQNLAEKASTATAAAAVKVADARSAERTRAFVAKLSYDGSHPAVERAVQRSMNDPSSYEHVSTSYSDNGSSFIVTTTFRGRNAFGGLVRNTATVIVTDSGEAISMGLQ